MDLIPLYSVPFWQTELPNFYDQKDSILDIVRKIKSEYPDRSDNGYESPKIIHKCENLCDFFIDICNLSLKCGFDLDFKEFNVAITSSWININESRNDFIPEKTQEHIFTGIFCLNVPEESGKIIIKNPIYNEKWEVSNLYLNKNQFTAESVKLEPEEGSIYIFPSYVPYSIESNNHDDESIFILFNMILFPKSESELELESKSESISPEDPQENLIAMTPAVMKNTKDRFDNEQ